MHEWMFNNALVNLGFVGPEFTWTKSPNSGAALWERLDRGVSSILWREAYPEAYIQHLPRLHSDHNPLLIVLNSNMTLERRRNRFDSRRCGASMIIFYQLCKLFGYLCKSLWTRKLWNSDTFGNLFQ